MKATPKMKVEHNGENSSLLYENEGEEEEEKITGKQNKQSKNERQKRAVTGTGAALTAGTGSRQKVNDSWHWRTMAD